MVNPAVTAGAVQRTADGGHQVSFRFVDVPIGATVTVAVSGRDAEITLVNGSGWKCSIAGAGVSCEATGAVGALTVVAHAPAGGNLRASLSAANDPDPTNNSAAVNLPGATG